MFATAILVVVTLTTLKFTELDVALKLAVHGFVWSAALYGGYLILSVTDDLPLLTRSFGRRLFGYALFAAGSFAWLRSAYFVLVHFQVSGVEIVLMQTVIVATIILAASDVSEHNRALLNAIKRGPAEDEPKP